MNELIVPGKIFLMGEYAVIEGGRSLLAAVRPGYRFSKSGESHAHPESPLGRYLNLHPDQQKVQMEPSGMAPGFGSSTAELIAALYLNSRGTMSLQSLWQWYRECYPEASGVDLLVQGKAVEAKQGLFSLENFQFQEQHFSKAALPFLVFSSKPKDKLATHLDLKKARPALPISKMNELVNRLERAIEAGDEEGYQALTDYADLLSDLGLESERASRIREEFLEIESICGAKGCGAGLNDVFLVAMSKKADSKDFIRVQEVAKEHHLFSHGFLSEILWS